MLGMYFVSKSNVPVSTNIGLRRLGVQYITRIVVVYVGVYVFVYTVVVNSEVS